MKVIGVLSILLLQEALAQLAAPSISQASNEFSMKAYELMSKKPGNLLFCPVSVHVALGLLHQGAGGNTAQELATVLGLTGSNSDIKEGYKTLLSGLQGDVAKIVTKLYPKDGYQLNENYIRLAQEVFQSGVETLNYSDPTSAANTINKYVEEKTNNKITNLIDDKSIDDNTRLIMVNAVHFEALWKISFKTVYDGEFRLSASESNPVQLMVTSGYYDYKELEDLNAKALALDYKGGNYSLVVVLPNEDDSNTSYSKLLNALETKLSAPKAYEGLFTGYQNKSVYVKIPKFKIESSFGLKDYLKELGIRDVFTEEADLHGIAEGDQLSVSEVLQKTFIDVNEKGTEAAAATGVIVGVRQSGRNDPIPEIFIADRPFMFFVVKERHTILFSGRYEVPN